ncbi:phosphoenolpyruvate kinase, partial [bacterium]
MSAHVAYGGAQLFSSGTAEKWRSLALAAFEGYVPTSEILTRRFDVPAELAPRVRTRVAQQLRSTAALSSLRIDFEDGYGARPDEEEDSAAEQAGRAVATLVAPPAELGIRPKGFAPATRARALRTLSRFLGALAGPLPVGFVVTLAKVQNAHEVSLAVGALGALEAHHGLAPVAIELMAETPGFFAELEQRGLERMHAAAEGRLRSIHFGAYDMLSALGAPGHTQSLAHPFCTPLRLALAQAAAPFELPVYDGATLAMPVPPHRGPSLDETQRRENHAVVLEAMAN